MLDDGGDQDVVAQQDVYQVVQREVQPHPRPEQDPVHLHVVAPVVHHQQLQHHQEAARDVVEVVVHVVRLFEPLRQQLRDTLVVDQAPEEQAAREHEHQRHDEHHNEQVQQHRPEPQHLPGQPLQPLLPQQHPHDPHHPQQHYRPEYLHRQAARLEDGRDREHQQGHVDGGFEDDGEQAADLGEAVEGLEEEEEVGGQDDVLEEVQLVLVEGQVEKDLGGGQAGDPQLVPETPEDGGLRVLLVDLALCPEVGPEAVLDVVDAAHLEGLVGAEEEGDEQVGEHHVVDEHVADEQQAADPVPVVEGQDHVGEVAGGGHHHHLIEAVRERVERVQPQVLQQDVAQRAAHQQVQQVNLVQVQRLLEQLLEGHRRPSRPPGVHQQEHGLPQHVHEPVLLQCEHHPQVHQHQRAAAHQHALPHHHAPRKVDVVKFKGLHARQKEGQGQVHRQVDGQREQQEVRCEVISVLVGQPQWAAHHHQSHVHHQPHSPRNLQQLEQALGLGAACPHGALLLDAGGLAVGFSNVEQ